MRAVKWCKKNKTNKNKTTTKEEQWFHTSHRAGFEYWRSGCDQNATGAMAETLPTGREAMKTKASRPFAAEAFAWSRYEEQLRLSFTMEWETEVFGRNPKHDGKCVKRWPVKHLNLVPVLFNMLSHHIRAFILNPTTYGVVSLTPLLAHMTGTLVSGRLKLFKKGAMAEIKYWNMSCS